MVSNLLTQAVDAIRPQQADSLLHQVCAATAEHTEAQVLQELRFSRGSIQSPRGTDAVIRSEGKARDSQCKQHCFGCLHIFSEHLMSFEFFLNTEEKTSAQEI